VSDSALDSKMDKMVDNYYYDNLVVLVLENENNIEAMLLFYNSDLLKRILKTRLNDTEKSMDYCTDSCAVISVRSESYSYLAGGYSLFGEIKLHLVLDLLLYNLVVASWLVKRDLMNIDTDVISSYAE
jgi:hypothetical protein